MGTPSKREIKNSEENDPIHDQVIERIEKVISYAKESNTKKTALETVSLLVTHYKPKQKKS